ncbi:hypothetical protein cyc_07201 [Cyclospora cayetanensis]|uniref:Uncharacterized protein n=1 Tax=Cyclospora cayetanensis TaxID=88456 RepID=A0A1D3D4G6_9EIME|nr:hypothetical protein cyc_07201 [Cyclospora cayetanensis]
MPVFARALATYRHIGHQQCHSTRRSFALYSFPTATTGAPAPLQQGEREWLFPKTFGRVGAEVYYEAAASAVVAQAEAAAEAAREAATTASARPVQQPPPFCMQLQGASEGSATPDGCSEQREQQQADIEEPRGGGVLLEVWLPGVSPRDIAVQLSLVGRHREAEIIPEARPPCGSVASTPSVDELASNYVLNEDFLWEETVEAAEERIANRRKPPYLPPPLPCLIINAPKSTRALKWETETFVRRLKSSMVLS